jgi:hypothetical protein
MTAQGVPMRLVIGSTARKLGNLGDECLILITPIYNYFKFRLLHLWSS